MQALNRRQFLAASTLSLAGLGLAGPIQSAEAKHASATGFFRVEERRSVWWFINPQGEPAVSLGVNHVEPRLMIAPTTGRPRCNVTGRTLSRRTASSIQKALPRRNG
jgi:hypothetical protein